MTAHRPEHERAAGAGPEPTDDPLEALRRWEQFGGTWDVVAQTARSATISLRRCDSGEEAHRITSTDPRLLDWIGDHHPHD